MKTKLIITNQKGFLKDIVRGMSEIFSKKFREASRKVTEILQISIPLWIENTPEIRELRKKETFWGELGIPPEILDSAIRDIKRLSASSVSVNIEKKPFGIGGLRIRIFRDNFSSFLTLPSGRYITEKGVEIPWLKSLLVDGSKIIVKDYEFVPKNYTYSKTSRTQKGIMKKSRGSFWRIPPQYSGTIDDNFLTRVIKDKEKLIFDLVLKEIQ